MILSHCSLQLYISKREAGWWPQFVIGDERGEMITDLDTADRISESLQYLTSEEMVKWLISASQTPRPRSKFSLPNGFQNGARIV